MLYGKSIYEAPQTYFNEQVMMALELAAKKEFLYGEMDQDIPEDI